jgi:ATP-dependent DNA helicase RecQ
VLSEEQIRGALNQAFTSRESAAVIAFSPGAVGEAHDMDSQALRTLLARLELRGVVRALTPAYDVYQLPLGLDGEAVAAALGPSDGALWRALVAAGKVGRTWLTLTLSEAARVVGISPEWARAIFRRAEEAGLIAPRAAGVLHRYEVLRRPDRSADLPALLQAVREAVEGEHLRLASVRAYVLETGCRVRHVLAYLGDPEAAAAPQGYPAACGTCDLCRGAPPIGSEALKQLEWRAAFDPAEVRDMAALNEVGFDPVGVARGLCQITTPRSRVYRKHPAWGRLERAPYGEVLAAVKGVLE